MLEDFNVGLVEKFYKVCKGQWMGFAEDLGMQVGPMLSPAQFREVYKTVIQKMMEAARRADYNTCILTVISVHL